LPREIDVAVLTADSPRFCDACAKFSRLVVQTPKRRADGDRRELAAGILNRVRLSRHAAIFLRKSRVEHSAKVYVAGGASSSEDHALARANVKRLAFIRRCNAKHSSRGAIFSDDACHPVLQENLHA